MWIILLSSLLRSYIPLVLKQKNSVDISKLQNLGVLSEANLFLNLARFKHAAPLFKSIGTVFFVSFVSLAGYRIGIIEADVSFPITLPIVSSLFFMSLPILNNMAIGALEKVEIKLDFSKIGCLALLGIVAYAFLYVFALLVLPIWSLIVIHPIYTNEPIVLLAIVVVIFLQIIVALLFMNYFSASSAKKELTIALFNLSSILNRINKLSFDQTISDDTYQELKRDYIKAKRYEVSADDTLLINFYNIIPNQQYLFSLIETDNNYEKPG